MKKNNYILKVLKLIIIYFSMIIIFFTMMLVQAVIPRNEIENQVKESSENFGGILYKKIGLKTIFLDNWSDAVIVNTAYSIDNNNILESIMLSRRSYDPERNLNLYIFNEYEHPVKDLKECIEKTNDNYYQYARYWHGYLIFLRPLLVFFNCQKIGFIYQIIIILLFIVLVYLIKKKVGLAEALIFILTFFVFSYEYAGLCLNYAPVIMLSILFSIYIIKKESVSSYLFFIIGGLTSFFDLLTVPLLTLRNTYYC